MGLATTLEGAEILEIGVDESVVAAACSNLAEHCENQTSKKVP